MTRRFKCLECGNCCERILVDVDGVHLGLCLHPGEETLFAGFPGAVVPCMGVKRPGRSRVKIVCYQMVIEPCPLFDPVMRRCIMYSHRPVNCKAYPFSFTKEGGHSIEAKCAWSKEQKDVRFGKTMIMAGTEQNLAAAQAVSFLMDLSSRMHRTGYTHLMMYDVELKDWVDVSPGE